jgi:hypothetical protein
MIFMVIISGGRVRGYIFLVAREARIHVYFRDYIFPAARVSAFIIIISSGAFMVIYLWWRALARSWLYISSCAR